MESTTDKRTVPLTYQLRPGGSVQIGIAVATITTEGIHIEAQIDEEHQEAVGRLLCSDQIHSFSALL